MHTETRMDADTITMTETPAQPTEPAQLASPVQWKDNTHETRRRGRMVQFTTPITPAQTEKVITALMQDGWRVSPEAGFDFAKPEDLIQQMRTSARTHYRGTKDGHRHICILTVRYGSSQDYLLYIHDAAEKAIIERALA